MRRSASYEVQVLSRYLARDVQSVTGKNLIFVEDFSQLDPWTCGFGKMRSALTAAELVEIPALDRWRLPYLCTLLSQRSEAHQLALEVEETRLDELIQSLVIN